MSTHSILELENLNNNDLNKKPLFSTTFKGNPEKYRMGTKEEAVLKNQVRLYGLKTITMQEIKDIKSKVRKILEDGMNADFNEFDKLIKDIKDLFLVYQLSKNKNYKDEHLMKNLKRYIILNKNKINKLYEKLNNNLKKEEELINDNNKEDSLTQDALNFNEVKTKEDIKEDNNKDNNKEDSLTQDALNFNEVKTKDNNKEDNDENNDLKNKDGVILKDKSFYKKKINDKNKIFTNGDVNVKPLINIKPIYDDNGEFIINKFNDTLYSITNIKNVMNLLNYPKLKEELKEDYETFKNDAFEYQHLKKDLKLKEDKKEDTKKEIKDEIKEKPKKDLKEEIKKEIKDEIKKEDKSKEEIKKEIKEIKEKIKKEDKTKDLKEEIKEIKKEIKDLKEDKKPLIIEKKIKSTSKKINNDDIIFEEDEVDEKPKEKPKEINNDDIIFEEDEVDEKPKEKSKEINNDDITFEEDEVNEKPKEKSKEINNDDITFEEDEEEDKSKDDKKEDKNIINIIGISIDNYKNNLKNYNKLKQMTKSKKDFLEMLKEDNENKEQKNDMNKLLIDYLIYLILSYKLNKKYTFNGKALNKLTYKKKDLEEFIDNKKILKNIKKNNIRENNEFWGEIFNKFKYYINELDDNEEKNNYNLVYDYLINYDDTKEGGVINFNIKKDTKKIGCGLNKDIKKIGCGLNELIEKEYLIKKDGDKIKDIDLIKYYNKFYKTKKNKRSLNKLLNNEYKYEGGYIYGLQFNKPITGINLKTFETFKNIN